MKSALALLFASALPLVAGELTFETKFREFKVAPDATKVIADFPFKNESKEAVKIVDYMAACSCISTSINPKDKLVYQPGESGVIRSEFELAALDGMVEKSVGLRIDKDPEDEPSVTLTTRIHIPVLVALEPKTLFWNTGEEAKPKTVTLTMNHSEPIKVTKISGTDERFVTEIKTVEEGKKYEVTVTPKATTSVAMAVIHVDTDCKLTRHRSQRLFAVVRNAPKPVETAAKP